MHASVKTAKPSLARDHMGGWGDRMYPGFGHCTRKTKSTHSKHNVQRSFDPPLTCFYQKKGNPGTGGGGQNQKNHWEIVLSHKMMILQGFRPPIPHLGVCDMNDPKGGYMAPTPALDLTTLFEVIWPRPLSHTNLWGEYRVALRAYRRGQHNP